MMAPMLEVYGIPRSAAPFVLEILEGMYGILVRRVLQRQKF